MSTPVRICTAPCGCDRELPPTARVELCTGHRTQLRRTRLKGGSIDDLKPLGRPRWRSTEMCPCGCGKIGDHKGLCSAAYQRSRRQHRTPSPKAITPAPSSKLPKDWFKPTLDRARRTGETAGISDATILIDNLRLDTYDWEKARTLEVLRRHDALDLAEMLGLDDTQAAAA